MSEMKLFVISQEVTSGYDTYDSAVVCAENEEDAKTIYPGRSESNRDFEWCNPEDVKVNQIGIATTDIPRGVIVASYNAG